MSRREQLLIIVGVFVVILLGFYYLIYQPKAAEYRALAEERDARQARLDQMERIAAQTPQLEARYRELTTFIATLEAKLPTEKEIPAFLVQMERLTARMRADLRSLRPGALEAVTASQTQGQPAQGQAGGTQGGAQTPQAAPEYYRLPVSLTFEAGFTDYVAFLGALRDFPRLIAVNRLTMAPAGRPTKLNVQAETETYVLPKGAR